MKTRSTFFCIVFALCANVSTTYAQVNVQDSLALVDLYNSTDGSHWYESGNWLTKYPVSNWVGITVTGNRVTDIDLSDNNIAGSLPSSIGNLSKMTILSLSHNVLSGSISGESF